MLGGGTFGRCLDDAGVLRAAGIGQDDEPPIMMIDRVVVLRRARGDQTRRRRQIGGVDKANLRGLVVVHAEQEVAAVLRRADTKEEAGIVLFMYQRVRVRRSDHMTQ